MEKATIEQALEEASQIINLEDDEQEKRNIGRYFSTQKHRIVQDLELCLSLSNNNSKILDVGCYPFFSNISLQSLGYNVVGVDLEPQRLPKIISHSGIDVRQCNIETETLPFESNSFDVILFCEVFEHLRIDLIWTTQELYRVLKPGGYMLLSTPNFLSFGKMLSLLLRGRTVNIFNVYNSLSTRGHAGHIREYTVREIKEFVNKIGFQCQETIYLGKSSWGLKPKLLLQAMSHRLIPATRNSFMLILVK